MLWIMRKGAPWRNLPAGFGRLQSVYDRFRAWSGNGLWAAIHAGLSKPLRDDEHLMINSTAMRVHNHGANPPGGQAALAKPLRPTAKAIMVKGYDSDALRAYVNQLGGIAVIPPKSNRALKPDFDEHLYRKRHRIENIFARIKTYRRIATRYEKFLCSFAAMVSLSCILVWLKS